jgi:hypothetical protein
MKPKKSKVKRFQEGGLPDYEREPSFEDKAQQGAAVAEYKMGKGMNPNLSDDLNFKEAFKAARDFGDKTFTWRNKKYTTELASAKPAAKSTPAPAAMPSKEEIDKERTRMEDIGKKQALVRVEPENYIPGTGLLKNIIKRGLRTISPPKQIGNRPSPPKQIGNQPTKMLPYRKSAAAKKADAEESGAMKGDVRGDELRYKKGGTVKNSASKRADGCAIRGKTRA